MEFVRLGVCSAEELLACDSKSERVKTITFRPVGWRKQPELRRSVELWLPPSRVLESRESAEAKARSSLIVSLGSFHSLLALLFHLQRAATPQSSSSSFRLFDSRKLKKRKPTHTIFLNNINPLPLAEARAGQTLACSLPFSFHQELACWLHCASRPATEASKPTSPASNENAKLPVSNPSPNNQPFADLSLRPSPHLALISSRRGTTMKNKTSTA